MHQDFDKIEAPTPRSSRIARRRFPSTAHNGLSSATPSGKTLILIKIESRDIAVEKRPGTRRGWKPTAVMRLFGFGPGKSKPVVDFDPRKSNPTFNLCMPKQQLDRSCQLIISVLAPSSGPFWLSLQPVSEVLRTCRQSIE